MSLYRKYYNICKNTCQFFHDFNGLLVIIFKLGDVTVDKQHTTSYNKGKKKLLKITRKRVSLMTATLTGDKKEFNPFMIINRIESLDQPAVKRPHTPLRKIRSVKESACERYLKEKHER